jgi:hypothetical protein
MQYTKTVTITGMPGTVSASDRRFSGLPFHG